MILLTTSERQKPQSTAEDPQILRDASKLQTIDLKAASGWAQEVIYQTNNQLGWTCPRYILKQGKEAWNKTLVYRTVPIRLKFTYFRCSLIP